MVDIKGFIENSLIEWEGKIASVIFLPGCNLRCPFCHAAHLILHPERLESIARPQVLDCMRRHVGWVDGAVLTGGEPTLHGDELLGLISEIREIPMQVMVETNGTRPGMVRRLIDGGFLDAIAMDFKAPLTREDYERVGGAEVHVEDVGLSVQIIKQSGLPHEFRTTLVPGLVGRDELERMLPMLDGARQAALQNFRPDFCLSPALREVTPYSPEEMDAFEGIVAPVVGRCVVRGRDHAAVTRSSAD